MNMHISIPQQDLSAAPSIAVDSLNRSPSLKCVSSNPKQHCKNCALHEVCLAKSVDDSGLDALTSMTKHSKPRHKGEHFYHQQHDFKSLYIVRSGAVKTYYLNEQGEQQITGFYLPGELFGIDGISQRQHVYSAQALDTTAVCEIPFHSLEKSFQTHPKLQRRVMEILCAEIYERQQPLLSLRQNQAEERLATFLTHLSSRLKQRGLSATEFNLPMSRQDIAGYLGVAGETMSRLFTRFQKQNLLSVSGRAISINDLETLQLMSATVH